MTAVVAVVATTASQATFAKAGLDAGSGACKQWQTATIPPTIDINAPLPEMGKPRIETAPEGWEQFALGYGGLLVYRRCAK